MGKPKTLIIMYFTSDEKKAIARVAVGMEAADGVESPREFLMIAPVFQKLGITNEELEAASRMSLVSAMQIISNMTTDEKRFVSAFLGAIIIADGDISDKEVSLWRFISSICEFQQMSVRESPEILKSYL